MRSSQELVLGTRGSDLARAQASLVESALRHSFPSQEITVRVIKTSGDDRLPHANEKAGRKGLFTAELERALVEGEIDVAVHSAKDLPSESHEGVRISAVLPRAPSEDLLVTKEATNLEALAAGTTVGTGSVRRRCQFRWRRPDLTVAELRGNVPTRLRKFVAADWHAIVLARAGLERLGFDCSKGEFTFEKFRFFVGPLDPEIFLPAGGQGIIALQTRMQDDLSNSLVQKINHPETLLALRAEREFLRMLGGDCSTPVGVLAVVKGGLMTAWGQLFEDTSVPLFAQVEGEAEAPEELANKLLKQLHGGKER